MNQNEKLILELLMEILLEAIEKKELYSYKKDVYETAIQRNSVLGEELHYHLKLGNCLGKLNKAICCKAPTAPTISAIVVYKETPKSRSSGLAKLPGPEIDGFPGFVGYKQANLAGKRQMAAQEQAAVFNYLLSDWKKIYNDLFAKPKKSVRAWLCSFFSFC